MDLRDHAARLLARSRNRALRQRTWQIATDGSQKVPQRLLGPAWEALAAGRPIPRLALAVAGWMRFVAGTDERGGAIDVRDPMLPALREACTPSLAEPRVVASRLLGLREVFGEDLPRDPVLRAVVEDALEDLARRGSRA